MTRIQFTLTPRYLTVIQVPDKGLFTRRDSMTVRELTDLNPGDYIVHSDHGIGRFGGLEKIEVNGRMQEAIKLVFKDNDILYVGIHALHRISKYKGKDDTPPRINKLGTGAWQKMKQATKKKVKDIARDLILLYQSEKPPAASPTHPTRTFSGSWRPLLSGRIHLTSLQAQ